MEQITKADSFILDKGYQRIADLCWEQWGVSCFILARISLIIDQGLTIPYGGFEPLMVIFGVLLTIWVFIMISQYESLAKPKFANQARIAMLPARLINWMCLICLGIPMTIARGKINQLEIGYIFWISTFYFVSCQTRLPLSVRKLVLDAS